MSSPTSSATAAASTTALAAPPLIVVSKADVVSIATWILLVTSSLAMLARLSTKWAVSKCLEIDDGLAIAALLGHIGSGVAVAILDKNGLGVDIDDLSASQKQVFGQSALAARLLLIGTLCCAKLSVVFLFNRIIHLRMHRLLCYWFVGFIAVWSAASIVGASLLCQAPETWDLFGQCSNPAAFWYAFCAINLVTDAGLIVVPTFIIIPLHISRSKKLMILSCFGARICDIGATIALVSFTDAYSQANFTVSLWTWVLASQFVQCMSIVTACIPTLKPLLDAFPSGMFMSDEIRRKGTNAEISADGYIRTPEPNFALRQVDSLSSNARSDQNFSRQSSRRPKMALSGTRISTGDDLDRRPLKGTPTTPPREEMGIVKSTTIVMTN